MAMMLLPSQRSPSQRSRGRPGQRQPGQAGRAGREYRSPGGRGQRWRGSRSASARLAMRLVLPAVRAVLAELDPVGVVTAVLAGDVVAVLALLTSQGDLRPDVCRSHDGVPFSRTDIAVIYGQAAACPRS